MLLTPSPSAWEHCCSSPFLLQMQREAAVTLRVLLCPIPILIADPSLKRKALAFSFTTTNLFPNNFTLSTALSFLFNPFFFLTGRIYWASTGFLPYSNYTSSKWALPFLTTFLAEPACKSTPLIILLPSTPSLNTRSRYCSGFRAIEPLPMKENNVRPEDLPKQVCCGLFEWMSYTYDCTQKSLCNRLLNLLCPRWDLLG